MSKLFADTGIITLASFISPYRADREKVRQRLLPGQFIEIYMKARGCMMVMISPLSEVFVTP